MDFKNVSDVLNGFAQYVVDSSKNNLTADKKGGGDLYNSIKYTYEKSEDMFLLDFLMEDYGPFVDKGVKGLTSTYPETASALSKFQYGSGTGPKNGLRDGIKKWVAEKRFQFRDKKTGRFMSYESTAYIIARSIYNKGLKANLFFTQPFEQSLKSLQIDLKDSFKLDIESGIILGSDKIVNLKVT
tara:strand:- start:4246 stop:4800 length:555 start_codon:yes stop_codon:yes gene_type:complete